MLELYHYTSKMDKKSEGMFFVKPIISLEEELTSINVNKPTWCHLTYPTFLPHAFICYETNQLLQWLPRHTCFFFFFAKNIHVSRTTYTIITHHLVDSPSEDSPLYVETCFSNRMPKLLTKKQRGLIYGYFKQERYFLIPLATTK